MKTISERADIIVVGGGLAGLCAAVSAAKSGSTVKLIEARPFLGGRIGGETRFPLDHRGGSNFVYQREGGILDELLLNLLAENTEGNYAGQNRAIMNWVSRQDRLDVFTGIQTFEASLDGNGNKIQSISAISEKHGNRILFKGQYFIDCTGTGALARMANAPGEEGTDSLEYSDDPGDKPIETRFATCMRISELKEEIPFECPEWVRLRWEDNSLAARLDLLESLDRNLLGDHNVEWVSRNAIECEPDSAQIVWAAWDYLKNRSPLVERSARLVIENFSTVALKQDGFRATGDFTLTPTDMEEGRRYPDSIAVGRSPMDIEDSMLCSVRGKVALPHPFEIPLRCLYSKKVKNLLLAGGHASCTSRASASLRHPPTSAQMGEAAGVCASTCIRMKRLPRTMAKSGYVDELRKLLHRANHRCSITQSRDPDDLIPDSKVIASSTLDGFSTGKMAKHSLSPSTGGIVQFPVNGPEVRTIKLYAEVQEDCQMQCGLFSASLTTATAPGPCLNRVEVELSKGGAEWIEIPLSANIENPGWHFLEFSCTGSLCIFEQENAPVGLLFHQAKKLTKAGISNPYSEFSPKTSLAPAPSSAPLIEVFPKQRAYLPENLTNGKARPDRLPNLWISQPTDFKYPEFVEFHWEKPQEISSIEVVFDGSLEFLFPPRPEKFQSKRISSIVKNYRFFYMDEVGHWKELFEISDNSLAYRKHEFPPITTKGLELEVTDANGLDRAQVFQVRAYS